MAFFALSVLCILSVCMLRAQGAQVPRILDTADVAASRMAYSAPTSSFVTPDWASFWNWISSSSGYGHSSAGSSWNYGGQYGNSYASSGQYDSQSSAASAGSSSTSYGSSGTTSYTSGGSGWGYGKGGYNWPGFPGYPSYGYGSYGGDGSTSGYHTKPAPSPYM